MRLETFLEEKVVTADGISPAAKPQAVAGRTAL
jgi:hypothetical protein